MKEFVHACAHNRVEPIANEGQEKGVCMVSENKNDEIEHQRYFYIKSGQVERNKIKVCRIA